MKFVKPHRNVIDQLEQRIMLAATVIKPIPEPTLQASGSVQTLALGDYFDDPTIPSTDTVVELETNLPSPYNLIPMELTTAATPNTVANFLQYVSSGEYANTIFHRSVPNFIIQGGGYTTAGTQINSFGNINGESSTATLTNTPGTIAMALSTGPNSATSEWFFNLVNNNGTTAPYNVNLNDASDGGPFTAFGQVIYQGMSVLDDIAGLPVVDDTANGALSDLPVQSGTNGATVSSEPANNLITINPVVIPSGLVFTANSSNSSVVTTSVSGANLTLTPGSTGTSTVTVTAEDLGLGMVTSTFNVSVVGTIVPPTVSVADASGSVGTNGQVVFPVTLSAASGSTTTLNYTLTSGTAGSSDYQASGSTLTIPAGSTTASIPVNVLGDSTGQAETFTLTLSSLSSNAVFANGNSTESATGTINPFTSISTTTAVTASSASVPLNGPETFTATVTAADSSTAAGTITFAIGGTTIGTSGLENGVATFSTDLSTVGDEIITAAYGGDSTHLSSTSSPLTVNVTTLTPAVSKSTLPTSIVAGTSGHGTTTVGLTNDTSAAEKGKVTVSVYASTDGTIDQNSVLLATTKRSVNIAPGKSVTVPLLIKSLPSTLAAGSYTLLTQTTDIAGNISDAASGPSLTVGVATISLTGIFTKLLLPTAVVAGSKTKLAGVLKITNNGNIPSVGITPISLYVTPDGTVASGTLITTISKKLSIKPGKFVAVSIPLGAYPMVADGNYYVVAQVTDPKGNLSLATSATQVNIAAAQVDLSAAFTSVPASTQLISRPFTVGLNISDSGNYTVTNTIDLTFALSPSSDGSNAVPLGTISVRLNVPAGGTQKFHFKVPVPKGLPTGDQYLVALVDSTDVLADSNPANNTAVSSSTLNIG